MSRHFIIAVATLFLGGANAFAQDTDSRSDSPGPYTTITTVIRVAEDIDEYLDESDAKYSRFQDDSLAAYDDSILQDIDPNSGVFEPASANWFSQYELDQHQRGVTTTVGATLASSDAEINMHIAEELATSKQDTPAPIQLGPPDWQAEADVFLATTRAESNDAKSQLPVIVASSPQPTSAQNAGLWLFLGLMTAPFAWLAWSEYKDLMARTNRAKVHQPEPETQAAADSEPCETKSRFMEAARAQELEEETVTDTLEEEIDFQEIGAASVDGDPVEEDDCEHELGVLEEANALLASVAALKVDEIEEVPQEETVSDAAIDSDVAAELADLTQLRGIGPATRDYLISKGIRNLNDLIEADVAGLQEILTDAGSRFQAAQPKRWVEQARDMLSAT